MFTALTPVAESRVSGRRDMGARSKVLHSDPGRRASRSRAEGGHRDRETTVRSATFLVLILAATRSRVDAPRSSSVNEKIRGGAGRRVGAEQFTARSR
jgi:hypothetical protein